MTAYGPVEIGPCGGRTPCARSTYARLKGRLAAQYSGDRRASTAAKVAFIQQLLSGD